MFTVENSLYLISNLFRIYVMYKFARAFLRHNNNITALEALAFALFFIINSAAHLFIPNLFINLATNILLFFAITFLYKSKIYKKTLATILIYAVNMFWEVIIYSVFLRFVADVDIILPYLVSVLMFFLTEQLFEHFSKFNGNTILSVTHLTAIIFLPTGCVIVGVFTMTQFNLKSVITAFILLSVNVMAFYLYDVLGRFYEEIREKSLLEQQNKAYINQLQLEDELHTSLRFFKHDMENHFIKMKDLLIHKNYSGLSDYLNACGKYVRTERKYSDSGNKDIDSLLNYKLREIGEKGTEINVVINLPDTLFISMFDLIVILGNLVDNAVEELKKCEKGRFKVEIKCKKAVLFILVENTCFSETKFENGRILTSKSEDKNHGLGLQSVQHALDKYNGEMTLTNQNNIFSVKALLYNSKPN